MTTPPGPQYPQYPQYPPGPYPQGPPYQPGPYPPAGPYYPPPGYGPPRPPGTNWWAVVSLVSGLIGAVVISVICGIVGLERAKTGHGGRGTAIAGLVISGLWVVVVVVGIALFLVFGGDRVAANKVAVGDCLKQLPASGPVHTVNTVDCNEQHSGEIFAVIEMPDGDFPGQFIIEQYQNKCGPELAKYSPEAASDPEVGLFVLYPSEDSWGGGDRTVTCIATTDTPRTGNLKK